VVHHHKDLGKIILEFNKHEKRYYKIMIGIYQCGVRKIVKKNVELGNSLIGIIPAVDSDWNVNFN
jgi:hypothetical protein